jgi:Recombination directionality factor-like
MPVLDLQRRAYQSGRIRLGQVVKTGKQDKAGRDITRPVKLDTLRFTSPSRFQVDAAAEAYEGEVRPWDNRGRKEWEVVTKVDEIMVAIPPATDAISQWYEMWTGGGCKRRCDSQRELKSGGSCLCPHASDPADEDEVDRMARERARLSKLMPPQACGLKTRVNLVLPDLPDIGVWRLDTGGFYAAGELVGKAELMRLCRDRDLFLPARLWIDQRVDVVDGQTRKYPVPALEIQKTFRQVATGELEAGGWAAQLPPAPGERPKAITAAPAAPAPKAEQAPPPAAPADETPLEDWQRAEQIAARGRAATTGAEMTACAEDAERQGLSDEHICTDRQNDTWEPLTPYLQQLWRDRARGAA